MRTLSKVAILALPTILLLLVFEWAAGVYLNSRFQNFDLTTQGGGEMAPSGYQLWEHPSNYWNWLKVSRYNNYGFRRFEDTSVQKPEGVVRIFIMGGSGALGSGANVSYPWLNISGQGQYSPSETIAGHLERLLNLKYPNRKYEVINAATNWAQLHQQIIHYLRKVKYFDPDLVISIDGQNDAIIIKDSYLSTWDYSAQWKVADLQSNFRVKLQPLLKRSNLAYLVAAAAFAERRQGKLPIDQNLVDKYVAMKKPETFDAAITDYAVTHSDVINRGVDFYISQLWHFSDILRRDNVDALFVQQPSLIMDGTKPFTNIETALRNFMFQGDAGYTVNFLRRVEQDASAVAQAEGLEYVSFLNIFGAETTEIYTDYCHLTPYGNEVLATRLISEIETRYPHLFVEEAVPQR